jgi:voltage-gated potassium channel
MEKLRKIIEESDTRAGRIFDYTIQALIILSLVSFTLETIPQFSRAWGKEFNIFERFVIAVFTAEYLLRIIVANRKSKYIFSFYGIVDLLAILPFYISTNVDLRTIRLFRLFRLLRLLKLVRYSDALLRMKKAIVIARDELIVFTLLTLILLYLSAVGIYYFENEVQPDKFSSIVDSLWWSVATLTTVGYGDVYPVTTGGRLFTFFVLMIGLGIVAVPTGIIASAFSAVRKEAE